VCNIEMPEFAVHLSLSPCVLGIEDILHTAMKKGVELLGVGKMYY
jgi:hypothetical protein